MKVGDQCHVADLPSNVFPVDIALGLQEIKNGNNITIEQDERAQFGIIIPMENLSENDVSSLHPDIKSRCGNSIPKKFVEEKISKSQTDDLKNGKIVLLGSNTQRSQCFLQVN